ncbi:alanyl-tRNA editing protein [Arsenicitalea aurantiaca]|uniref:Alanine--tRNA ligase n=1 Tax=Arsenicitalea aurantiaca TaxID=1783274 RepID=A0A433XES9_9HYPH|nr:alanyl-tRNA editing protein [Arsenicitalea aurantiaca]RUT32609.1 alanyl-tRNA editing protein [Arsenicitalea aurantiaca]
MTEFIFRSDSYLKTCTASVLETSADGGVELDRTIFYAASGGQPGDTGTIEREDGQSIAVTSTIHPDGDKTRIVHLTASDAILPEPGQTVTLKLDWDRRYRLMRMHTALHLLSVVFPYPVTGGAVGEDKGRLDFDMEAVPTDLAAIEAQLNGFVDADLPVSAEWISDEEMAAQPELVKTMKVKPPSGQGRVRLIRIGDIDLQPCGGTHVARTGEIGRLSLGKIEKKGKINRRVSLLFAER